MPNEDHPSDAFGSPHGSLAGLFRVAFLFLAFSGGIAGAESGVPGIMLPELTQVTPEMIAKITALDKATGKTLWQSSGFEGPAHYGSCTPFTFNGKRMIAAGTGGGSFCVDARSGVKVFSDPFSDGNTANCPSPAFSAGFLAWATGYGKGGLCMRLGPTGAAQVWATKELVCTHGGYLIDRGFIYGNHERGLACLELKTGQTKWFEKELGNCSLTYADGMLYVLGENNGAVALVSAAPDGFKLAGRFSVQGEGPSWAHPAVTGGRLYLRYGTYLYCLDVSARRG